LPEFKINLPDRELACAPFSSPIGQEYWQAMAASANFAWTNRQIITDLARKSWTQVLGNSRNHLSVVYDVAHNIAKLEKHDKHQYIVHRKGATRAFGPGHPEIPKKYQATGQPVFIPGSMGTNSYVLAGTEEAMQNTFGSACHGAGRSMSRFKAKKNVNYNKLLADLENYGVVVRANSIKGLLEEAPEAYKDVNAVVDVVCKAKIARKIAKLKPVAIIKG
jgi:tRNA-splicing ligase RtcB